MGKKKMNYADLAKEVVYRSMTNKCLNFDNKLLFFCQLKCLILGNFFDLSERWGNQSTQTMSLTKYVGDVDKRFLKSDVWGGNIKYSDV